MEWVRAFLGSRHVQGRKRQHQRALGHCGKGEIESRQLPWMAGAGRQQAVAGRGPFDWRIALPSRLDKVLSSALRLEARSGAFCAGQESRARMPRSLTGVSPAVSLLGPSSESCEKARETGSTATKSLRKEANTLAGLPEPISGASNVPTNLPHLVWCGKRFPSTKMTRRSRWARTGRGCWGRWTGPTRRRSSGGSACGRHVQPGGGWTRHQAGGVGSRGGADRFRPVQRVRRDQDGMGR